MSGFINDTWNPALIVNGISEPIYSDWNQIVHSNGPLNIVQNNHFQNKGKWYAEITVAFSEPNESYRVGIAGNYADFEPLTYLGDNNFSIGWMTNGQIISNGEYVSVANSYMSGNTVCVAADFDNNRVWFRVDNGPWGDEENTNNAIGSNPYSLIGGSDISEFSGLNKYVTIMLNANSIATINALQYMPPVGFTPWINPLYNTAIANSYAILNKPIATSTIYATDYAANVIVELNSLYTSNSYMFVFNPYDVTFPFDPFGAQARVNIFDMPVIVMLTLTDSYTSYPVIMNYPINKTDFNLIRGVPNCIQFFVRDVNKLIPNTLANATLTINIVAEDTIGNGILLLQRDLTLVNSATCLYALQTFPNDLSYWPEGFLNYSIQVTKQDGTQSLLWTDRNYSPYSYCSLLNGPIPGPPQPYIMNTATFIIKDGYRYSSPLPGSAQNGFPDGIQTFSFYTNNFTGNVAIQGSLVTQPSNDYTDWFFITYQNFNMSNGVTQVTVEGQYLWLRAVVPTIEPTILPNLPPFPVPTGNVSQIIYMN